MTVRLLLEDTHPWTPPGSTTRLRVEAQPQLVHRLEPEVLPATVGVRAGQGAAGGLDAGPADGLGRERDGLLADHLEAGPRGVLAGEQVEHHVTGEPGRAHTESGE